MSNSKLGNAVTCWLYDSGLGPRCHGCGITSSSVLRRRARCWGIACWLQPVPVGCVVVHEACKPLVFVRAAAKHVPRLAYHANRINKPAAKLRSPLTPMGDVSPNCPPLFLGLCSALPADLLRFACMLFFRTCHGWFIIVDSPMITRYHGTAHGC
jgi:hypothetical protein